MILSDAVLGQMHVDNTAGLQHQLPNQTIRNALINVADIDGGLLVLFPMSAFSAYPHT